MDDFRQLTGLDQATSDDTITLARIAAEAIRGLNWLTGCEAGLSQPSAARDAIGALALAASRLGQAFTQITRWPGQALAAGRRGHDRGEDPAEAIDATGTFPGGASMSAAALAQHLNQAQQELAPSTATPATATTRNSHDRQAPGPLRIHPHAVRPRPGPRHAPPPRRPQRGLRPDHLVHR